MDLYVKWCHDIRRMTKHASILGREAHLGFYVGKFPHAPKRFVMKQSNCSSSRKIKKKTEDALLFFFYKFWGRGGGGRRIFFFSIFLWFPMCSHYVPFKFPMGSHQVPNTFPKFSMCSPTCSP